MLRTEPSWNSLKYLIAFKSGSVSCDQKLLETEGCSIAHVEITLSWFPN